MSKMSKVKTLRIDMDSEVGEWTKNQHNFNASTTQAIKYIINKFGTGDLFDSIIVRSEEQPVKEQASTVSTKEEQVEEAPSLRSKISKSDKETTKPKLAMNKNKDNENDKGKIRKKPNLDMLS